MKPPFDEFIDRQKRWGAIWEGSWFFGLAIRAPGPGELALVLGKLILRTAGLTRPSVPSGQYVHVPAISSGLMLALDQAKTIELLAALSVNALPNDLQAEFKEAVVLPALMEARWNLSTNKTPSGDALPNIRLERIVSKNMQEVVGADHVERTEAALRSPGAHIDGLREFTAIFHWRMASLDTVGSMLLPTFEISADLPLRLVSFEYDESRSGYVVRVKAGAAVPRPVTFVSLLLGLKGSRPLPEFTEVSEDSAGFKLYETVFASEWLATSVKATLFFQQSELESREAPPKRDESSHLPFFEALARVQRDASVGWPWTHGAFDPELEDKTRGLIESREWDSAIRKAFVVLTARLAARYGVPGGVDGLRLVNEIFAAGSKKSELKDSDRQAMRDLLAGLYGVFRNKYGHEDHSGEWHEVEAIMTMVNSLLLELDRERSTGRPPKQERSR
jgi:hypothetical protein